MRITENLQENFPFISVINYVDQEFVGIIINQDNLITSIYDYAALKNDDEKAKFLELGEAWWWESNRQIPINIFLNSEIFPFRYAIRNFNTKDVKVIVGPCTSLNDIITKRIKRRSIVLVRKPS
jgi:AICAR transformylase/IMP cyclohydrolase PurH